jgi:hypothetical protein
MSHWNLKRAARFGYLAGRSLSIGSIIADDVIAARSERAVRCAASRPAKALHHPGNGTRRVKQPLARRADGGSLRAWIRDLDGHELELAEHPPGR